MCKHLPFSLFCKLEGENQDLPFSYSSVSIRRSPERDKQAGGLSFYWFQYSQEFICGYPAWLKEL